MPKMKTKKSASKRFSLTATRKVRANQANKRHNLSTLSPRSRRGQRGKTTLNPVTAKFVMQFLPKS